MVNNTCTLSFCSIPYCMTCLSVSTCSACVTGFTLSVDNATCASDCSTNGFANCLFCSGSACILCDLNYANVNGACTLPCSAIINCVACLSATRCAACSAGFSPSANFQTCDQVCSVSGCAACTTSTATSCTTCSTGYSPYTQSGNTLCAPDCSEG